VAKVLGAVYPAFCAFPYWRVGLCKLRVGTGARMSASWTGRYLRSGGIGDAIKVTVKAAPKKFNRGPNME